MINLLRASSSARLRKFISYSLLASLLTVVAPVAFSSSASAVGAASKLAITTAPSQTPNGVAFGIQPVITIQDSSSLTVTGSSAVVTVSIASGSGGTLIGSTSATAVNGVATFSNLGINGTLGNAYTLSFASTGLTSVTSSSITLSGNPNAPSCTATSSTIISCTWSAVAGILSYRLGAELSTVSGAATFTTTPSGSSGTSVNLNYPAGNPTTVSSSITVQSGVSYYLGVRGYSSTNSTDAGGYTHSGFGPKVLVSTTALLSALTPTFDTPVRTATGFTVNVTNYNSSYSFTPSVSSGSVTSGAASGTTLPITVSGVSAGASSTLTVGTSRSGYTAGTATVTGTALSSASLTIATPTRTSTGATYTLTNTGATVGAITVSDTTKPSTTLTNALSGSTYTISGADPGDQISVSVPWTAASGYTCGGSCANATATTSALSSASLVFGSKSPTTTGATYTLANTGATVGTITVTDTTYTGTTLTNTLSGSTYTISGAAAGDAISISIAWSAAAGYACSGSCGPLTGTVTASSNPPASVTFNSQTRLRDGASFSLTAVGTTVGSTSGFTVIDTTHPSRSLSITLSGSTYTISGADPGDQISVSVPWTADGTHSGSGPSIDTSMSALLAASLALNSPTPTSTGATYSLVNSGATVGAITVTDTTHTGTTLTNTLSGSTYTISGAAAGDAISISIAWSAASGYACPAGTCSPITGSTAALQSSSLSFASVTPTGDGARFILNSVGAVYGIPSVTDTTLSSALNVSLVSTNSYVATGANGTDSISISIPWTSAVGYSGSGTLTTSTTALTGGFFAITNLSSALGGATFNISAVNTSAGTASAVDVTTPSNTLAVTLSAGLYTVSGASGGDTINITVVCIPDSGYDCLNATASTTSTSATSPGAPTSVTSTDVGTNRAFNNGAATVSWSAPSSNGGSAITSYTVTSSPGGLTCSSSIGSPITPNCTVTGLTSGTAYTYTVTATNAAGTSSASSASSSVTATTVPQAPTIGSVTSSSGSATIAFTANATGGKSATYTATSTPGSFTGTGTSPITVSGLTNGTSYTFTVTATNANGTSSASSASASATPNKVTPTISAFTIPTLTYGTGASFSATPSVAGTLTFKQGTTTLCTILASAATSASCSAAPIAAGTGLSFSVTLAPTDSTNYASASSTGTADVGQRSITITAGSPTVTYTGSAATPTNSISVTSGTLAGTDAITTSSGTYSYSTANPTNVGTYTITVTGASFSSGSVSNYAITYAIGTLTINKANHTITITSSAPSSPSVGGSTYTITATDSASQGITFSIDSSASSVCSISTATVTFNSHGLCVINANTTLPASSNYNVATQAQQSFSVATGGQTVSFSSTAPTSATVGGSTYSVSGSATSGLTPMINVDSSASAVCSISTGTVSFTGVGTCVLNINQAGNANYSAATQVQQSFAVGKGAQVVTITSSAPSATVGGSTYSVTTTGGGSGNSVVLTIDASASSVCSLSGSVVSFLTVGTCKVNANQAGNSNYNAATQVQQSFTVSAGTQASLSLSATTVTYLSTLTLSATGGSGTGAVSYSSNSVNCTISGSTLTAAGASGTCTITATKAADSNYSQATTTATVTLDKATPTLNWSTPAATTINTAIGSSRLNPTASVAGTWAYADSLSNAVTSSTSFPSTGSQSITATFSPTDSAHYKTNAVTVNISILGAMAPDAPTLSGSALATGSANGQVTITWTAPASNGGATISDYEYRIALSASSPSFGLWTSLVQGGDSGTFTKTISGLNLGSNYVVQLRSKNSTGYSPATATSNVAAAYGTPVVIPASAPTSFSGTPTADPTAVSLSFNSVSGATSYLYTGDNGTTWSTLTTTGSSSLSGTVSGLTKGTAYTFKVKASNSAGTGPTTSSYSYTPYTAPTDPTINTVTVGSHKVTINFLASSDKGGYSSVTYQYRVGSSGEWNSLGSSAGNYDLEIENDNTYTIYVRATNAKGSSSGVSASANTTRATAPVINTQPSSVTTTVGQSAFTLSVTATAQYPSAPRSEVLSYQWYKRSGDDSSGTAISGATSATYAPGGTITSSNKNTLAGTYYVVVTSTSNGTTATTQSSNAVVTINTPATITTTSLRNASVGQTGYSDKLLATGGTASRGDDDSYQYTWALISPDTNLFKSGGLSLNTSSGAVTGTIPSGYPSGTVTIQVRATDSAGTAVTGSVTLTISMPLTITTTSVGNAASGQAYSVTLAVSGGSSPYTWSLTGDESRLPDGLSLNSSTGVISGNPSSSAKSTSFSVRVTDANGSKDDQALTINITSAVPNATSSLTQSSGNKQIILNWVAPTPVSGATITNYVINFVKPSGEHSKDDGSDDGEQKNSVIISAPATSYTLTGLTNGLHYTITVSAKSTGGTGAPSNSVTGLPYGNPSAPKSVSLSAKSSGLQVKWNGPDDNGGSSITGWTVGCMTGTTPVTITSGSASKGEDNQYTFIVSPSNTSPALQAGNSYKCRVQATNSSTSGDWSEYTTNVLYASVPGIPTIDPTRVDTSRSNEVTLYWAIPSNGGSSITGYTAWVKVSDGDDNDSSRRSCTTVGADHCTISGTASKGDYRIQVIATNAIGNSNASSYDVHFAGKTQTLTVASTINKNLGDPNFSIGATLSSGNHARYSVASGETRCSILGESQMVHLIASGTCDVTVSQDGHGDDGHDSDWAPISSQVVHVVIADAVPGAPTFTSVVTGNSQLTINWKAPTTGGVPTGYKLQYANCSSDGATCTWASSDTKTVTATPTNVTYTLTGLTNGNRYKIQIQSVNGASSPSAWVVSPSTYVPVGAPDKPVISDPITVYVDSSTVTVSWAEPNTNGAAITGYTILGTATGQSNVTCSTPGTTRTCNISGLHNKSTYSFVLTATNSGGSTASDPKTQLIGGRSQTISYTSGSAPSAYGYTVGDPNLQLSLRSSSGNALIFTATDPTTCSVTNAYNSSASVAFFKSGVCEITISQDGTTWNVGGTARIDTNFNAATSVMLQLNVDPATPSAPTLTSVTSGSTGLTVAWNPPARMGASSLAYTVTAVPVAPSGGSNVTCTLTSSATTGLNCVLLGTSGLVKGTQYSVTVIANNTAGNGPSSTALLGTWLTAPSSPQSPAAAATPSGSDPKGIHVTWTASASNGGAPISAYTFTATPVSGSPVTCSTDGSGTSCDIHGLRAGRTYGVTGVATNSVGNSSPVTASSSITPGVAQTISGGGSKTMKVTDADFSIGATVSSGKSPVYSTTDSTCTVSSAGLVHAVAVGTCTIAINAPGASDGDESIYIAATPASYVVTITADYPGAPTITLLTPSFTDTATGNTKITVLWTLPSNTGGQAITGSTANITAGGSGSCTVTGTTRTCDITGLNVNTSYTITVTTNNGYATATSAPATAIAEYKLTAPVPVTASGGVNKITLTWNTPATNSTGHDITAYQILESASVIKTVGLVLTTDITSLATNSTHSYTVQALAGDSVVGDPSTAVSATTFNVPTLPTSVAATAGYTTSATASVSWTASSSDGGSAITSYTATATGGSATKTCTTVNGSTTTCTITGLDSGATYTITVYATNAVGNSPVGTAATSLSTLSVPAAPTLALISTSVIDDTATVNWSMTNTSGVTGYIVKAYTNSEGTTYSGLSCIATNGSATACTINGLAYKTPYYFRVAAKNAAGTGLESDPSSAYTLSADQTITFPAITTPQAFTNNSVTVSASASSALTVALTIDPTTTSNCTVGGGYITFLAVGTCIVHADQGGNSTYNAAPQVTQTIVISAVTPDPVTLTTLTPGASQLTAAWSTARQLGGSNLVNYIVTYAPDAGFSTFQTLTTTNTSYVITGLNPATNYWVKVNVLTDATDPTLQISPDSNVLNAMTFGRPNAVAKPTAMFNPANPGTVVVSWTDIDGLAIHNGGSPVTTYVAHALLPGGADSGKSCTASSTTCSVAGLSGSITYTFIVVDFNAVGSNTSVPSDSQAPGASQTITVTPSYSKIHGQDPFPVSASTTSGLPLTYTVISSTAAGTDTTWYGSRVVCSVDPATGVVAVDLAGTCVVRVTQDGKDASGNSTSYFGATAQNMTITVAANNPTGIINGAAQSGNASLVITWLAPADDGGSKITSYKIKWIDRDGTGAATNSHNPADSDWLIVDSAKWFNYLITGLDNGETYDIYVEAINAAGLVGAIS